MCLLRLLDWNISNHKIGSLSPLINFYPHVLQVFILFPRGYPCESIRTDIYIYEEPYQRSYCTNCRQRLSYSLPLLHQNDE